MGGRPSRWALLLILRGRDASPTLRAHSSELILSYLAAQGAYDAAANNFTFGRGGFQGARGEDAGGDFFVENVFEELDHPGEFFFNESTLEQYGLQPKT